MGAVLTSWVTSLHGADLVAAKLSSVTMSAVDAETMDGATPAAASQFDNENDGEDDDLSADGPIAARIRADLAAREPLPDSRFVVADTGEARGFGLFVGEEAIESGTFLMDYHGELLEQAEYDRRYRAKDGSTRADYVVGVDRPDGTRVYLDAVEKSKSNLGRYMNHADDATANCAVWTLLDPVPRVMIFAMQDLASGEELRWNYGANYWEDRDDKTS